MFSKFYRSLVVKHVSDLNKLRRDFIDGLDGAELSEDDHIFVVRCLDQAIGNAQRTECCAVPIDRDERYCPRCGWETRVVCE